MMQQRFWTCYLLLLVVSLKSSRSNVASADFLLSESRLSSLVEKLYRRDGSSSSEQAIAPKQPLVHEQGVKEQKTSSFVSSAYSIKQQRKQPLFPYKSSTPKSSSSQSRSSSASEEDEQDEDEGEEGDEDQDEPLLDNLRYLEKLGKLQVKLAVHRNGDASPCGSVSTISRAALEAAMTKVQSKNDMIQSQEGMDKYEIEAFLTAFFLDLLNPGACGSVDDNKRASSFAGYCDMGPDRTVVQPDYKQLIRVGSTGKKGEDTLPCRFYTREGLRVSSLQSLAMLTKKANEESRSCFVNHLGQEECSSPTLNLYAVPAGRVFIFAPKYVGETFVVNHVEDAIGDKFVMEVLSLAPRVFELFNFFTLEEADQLIQQALSETDEDLKLQRSTTVSGLRGASVVSSRTSDNSWDIYSDVAIRMKRRCLEFLGFDEYNEDKADGLQIARYAETQGYDSHEDYMSMEPRSSYNYDTSTYGGNRFATIVMYLTDHEETDGGETLFPSAFPPGQNEKRAQKEVIRELRASGQIDALTPGSWEEDMTALCRTRLTVKPKKGRAIMFYLQHPNGKQDKAAWNGACPVLNGTKWDATLWGWSAPSPDNPGAPQVQKQAWW